MTELKNILTIETIHFIASLRIALSVCKIVSIKYKDLHKNKFINRIIKDRSAFIEYLTLIVLCIILSVISTDSFISLIGWTFKFITLLSMGQYFAISTFNKETGNEHYKKVTDIVDLIVIVAWGWTILTKLMSIDIKLVSLGVMAVLVMASLCGLKELNHIENDHISKF